MGLWWVCKGCGVAAQTTGVGIPQCPCECGDCRWTQTSKEEALSNNPEPCDDHVSDDRLAELADEAEDLR